MRLEGCAGTEEYHRSTLEAVLVQQSNIGALRKFCWYSRVRYDHSGGCAVTAEYNRRTR